MVEEKKRVSKECILGDYRFKDAKYLMWLGLIFILIFIGISIVFAIWFFTLIYLPIIFLAASFLFFLIVASEAKCPNTTTVHSPI